MTRDHLMGYPPAAENEARAEQEARTDALWRGMRPLCAAYSNPWVPLRITQARDEARARMMRDAAEDQIARSQSPWNGRLGGLRHTDVQGLAVDPRLTPKQRAWLARRVESEDAPELPF